MRAKEADLILTADWHIRETDPVCWVHDFWEAQEEAIRFLGHLQQEHRCPIVCAGDVFDRWNPSLYLVGWALGSFPEQLVAIPGQHDLPQHRLDRIERAALHVLSEGDRLALLDGALPYELGMAEPDLQIHAFPWGVEPKAKRRGFDGRKIAVCHTMTYPGKELPFPGCSAPPAEMLLEKMEGFDLIVTGDNHEPFVVEKEGRLLVNPGSLMRLTAAQIDHLPRVYLWYAEGNEVEPAYLPYERGAISREHIDIQEERDERIEAFVERLKEDVEIGLSFEKNLKEFMSKKKIRKAVRDLVWEMVG